MGLGSISTHIKLGDHTGIGLYPRVYRVNTGLPSRQADALLNQERS